MPPRQEIELDAVTLHNVALMNMEKDPTAGFRKFQYLLQQVQTNVFCFVVNLDALLVN